MAALTGVGAAAHLDGVPVDLGEVPDLLLVGAQAGTADVPGQVGEVRVCQHGHVPCTSNHTKCCGALPSSTIEA